MKITKWSLLVVFILIFLAPLKGFSATWSEVKPLIVSKISELKVAGKVGWVEIENSTDGNFTAKIYSYKADDKLFRAYISIYWYDGCCDAYQNFYFTYYADGSMKCNRTQNDYYHVLNDKDHNNRDTGWVNPVRFHWEYNGAWSVYPTKGYLEADPNPYLLWNPNDPSRPHGNMRLYNGYTNVYYNYFDPWNLKYKPKTGTGSLTATYVFTIPATDCDGIEIVSGGGSGDGTTLTPEDCNYIVNNAPGWEYGAPDTQGNSTVIYDPSKINLRKGSFSYKNNSPAIISSFNAWPTILNLNKDESVTISGIVQNASTWNLKIGTILEISGNGNFDSFLWDGIDSSGNKVLSGTYTATLTASSNGGACTDQKTLDIVVKGCEVEVMKFSGSDAVISPENGGIINFGGNIESQQDIDWKIDITGPDFAGKTISGGGPSVAAEWDGKDENGKVAEPGLYTATLTASDINGECSDTKEISFAVEPSENSCALLVNFGSSANVTSGNLSHSQTLFSTKTGGVALHYNSLEGYDGPLGTGWNHSYDIFLKDSGSSVMLREGDGHKKLFTLTGEGYISQPGDYSTLVRNADGGYTLFKKDGTRYDFGADGKVASITDRNGGAVSFAYEEGMLVSVADQYDRTTGFQYNAGRLSGIEDPAGNVYTFIVDGSLASVIYPDGGAWSYTYDGNGFMLTKTDPAGYTTHYEYDSERRAVRSTDPEGGVKSVEYPGGAEGVRTTTVVEKDGGVWRYTYDTQAGTLTGKTDPEGGATSYTYDASGNMLTRTEPDGSVTSYAYDAYGNTTSVTDAAGQTTRYAYNEFGQVTSVIGPEGNATANEYDANGNLLSITDPSGARTMYTYNAQGHITSVTDAMGQTTTFGYDQYGNRVSTTDPTGAITSFVYDEQGNMTSQTDANGAITRYEYDAAGRLVKVIDPTGNETSYTYDINGNRASQTDANGNTTFYEYNYKGQLVKVTDALGNTTTYAYGGAGCASCSGGGEALTSVTDANGNTTKYEYDSLGRKVKEIDPLGDVTSFSYNSRGVMASRSDANGSTITFNYDIKDRLITKTYSDGTNDIFTYDTKGNITFAANQYASYTYTYDVLDRATSVTDSAGKSISYEYDKLGNRTKTVAPDGSATSYVYDLGRLSEIKSFAGSFTFAYDALGRRTRLSMPNGTTANYSYNMTGNLTNLVHKPSSGPAFASFAYTHDKIGNRLTKTETETKYSYSYDKLYQLIQSLPTKLNGKDKMQENKAETFSYDRLGNRLSGPDTKDVYSYGTGNQLLSDRKNKYQYDKNGNLISRTETDDGGRIISWTCEYDFESKLTRVTKAASEEAIVVSFKYDPFGKRIEKKIEKTENGITEKKIYNYIYDNEDIIAEYLTKDDGKDEATRYVHGPGIDEPLAIERNKEVYYYHADGLGSIVALTDSKQRAVEKYDYDSFGNVKRNGDKVKNTFTYTGREWDEEIGYYYNRARYYDPRAGRFVSKDPIGFEGGINFYVYTANNPVSFIDPTGFKLISLQEGIAIVNNAKTWLGVPYQSPWNASNPRLGIDCSRLVWKVYNEVGFTYSYASTSSFASLENFEKVNAPQEGDVALYNGHMGIYTNGQLLSARSGLGKVGMSPLTWYGPMKGYYRYDKCN